MSRTPVCRYCCGACHRHFASLDAFDAHRVGDHSSNDPETRRRCMHPLDLEDEHGQARLEAATREGECRMLAETETGVTIWARAKASEELERLRLLGAQGLGSEGLSGLTASPEDLAA